MESRTGHQNAQEESDPNSRLNNTVFMIGIWNALIIFESPRSAGFIQPGLLALSDWFDLIKITKMAEDLLQDASP